MTNEQITFINLCVCVCVCVGICIQERVLTEANPLELNLQVFVNCLIWELRTEHRSSAKNSKWS